MTAQLVAAVDLAALLPSWNLALQADRMSGQTVDAYTTGVWLFPEWFASQGHDPIWDLKPPKLDTKWSRARGWQGLRRPLRPPGGPQQAMRTP